MPKDSVCIKVPKISGEKAIVAVSRLKIVEKELEIQKNTDFIYIPLVRQPSENELKTLQEQVQRCEVSTHFFPKRRKQEKSYVEFLENKLPPHLLASLPHSLDLVGDIAIIEIPSELDAYKNAIGEAFLKANKNIRTVLAKASVVGGTYRLRDFEIVAGEPKTDTIHKEYGCKFYMDLAKAYFSPRLSYEHKRIASLIENGETVLDLFAGVGPFAMLIAKNHENVKVYAIDVNPHAFEFLKRNVRLNRVENRVYPLLGDARQVVRGRLSGIADRVIMNLPESAIEFVDVACEALKPTGGIVHFYSFVNASDSIENMRVRFTEVVERRGRKVEAILFSRFVRATAPYEWQAVLDAKIR
jgi:tRNA (guanine37-N1)-methyltransferase